MRWPNPVLAQTCLRYSCLRKNATVMLHQRSGALKEMEGLKENYLLPAQQAAALNQPVDVAGAYHQDGAH